MTDVEIASVFNAGVAGKLKTVATPTGFAELGGGKALTNISPQAVSVQVGDVSITFASVTTAGVTQQVPLETADVPALPAGMTHTGLVYDISTSAVTTGDKTLCFNLKAFAGLTQTEFNERRILHLVNGAWIDRTSAYAFASQVICATSPTLSPFAIVDSNLAPTAANVSVSGRVITASGQGLRNAAVTLTGTDGITRRVVTSSFGYYRFDDVPSGGTYVVGVTSKRYEFTARSITVADDLSDLDFVAE